MLDSQSRAYYQDKGNVNLITHSQTDVDSIEIYW
jgi:hypothetical protein